MAIIRCPHGHFYDGEKYSICPYCDQNRYLNGQEEQKTVNIDEQTEVILTPEESTAMEKGEWDSERTMSISSATQEEEIRYIAGWLVCTAGPQKGRDFRLYYGFNRIGRDLSGDICIQDSMISKENHCSVVYDKKNNEFYLVPGKGTLTYVKGEALQKAIKLYTREKIRIGKSEFDFIAYCEGEYVWDKI